MSAREKLDFVEIRAICVRLFANRNRQPWPSKINANEEWRLAYDRNKGVLPVLQSADEAVSWANDLVTRIDAAR